MAVGHILPTQSGGQFSTEKMSLFKCHFHIIKDEQTIGSAEIYVACSSVLDAVIGASESRLESANEGERWQLEAVVRVTDTCLVQKRVIQ